MPFNIYVPENMIQAEWTVIFIIFWQNRKYFCSKVLRQISIVKFNNFVSLYSQFMTEIFINFVDKKRFIAPPRFFSCKRFYDIAACNHLVA